MTQHKCGTCRFYEAGTQHGSCRNPANPRRDDVALLRPDELGCRAGWGKDHWIAATTIGDDVAASPADADSDPTQPIPRVTGEAHTIALTQSTPPAGIATPGGVLAHTRRGFQGPVMALPGGMTQAPNAAKDTDVKRETSLENHPELNEQGIPYRNSSKRSSVAEAHRRALERREKERVAKEERDQVRLKDTPQPPTPEVGNMAPVGPTPSSLSPSGRAPLSPIARTSIRPITIKPEGETLELPQRAEIPLPSTPPRAPMMPRPTPPPPIQSEPEAPVVAAKDEAIDRVIPNIMGPVVVEPPREARATIPGAPSEDAPAQAAEERAAPTNGANMAPAAPEPTPVREPAGAPTAEAEGQPRYWHEMPSTGQYTRMELPPVQGGGQRQPSPVGRQRPEPPVESRPIPGRRIRTIDEVKNGLPAATAPIEPAVVQPPRVSPPRPATAQPAPIAAPAPEVAPRQIDEALLKQLETNWRTQELAAHTGQRCGNCRFFRAAEGGQGNCGCSFSNVYGRPIEPQGLSCLDGLGAWWAATDDGWLERTERRPRRATPLLDALLREREDELARSMPERRRAR